MLINKEHIQGVAFIAIFALIATLIASTEFCKSLSLHPLIIGMIGGVILANTFKSYIPKSFDSGIHFSTKRILRLGIILYGFRITFQNIFEVGLGGVVISTIMVVSTLIVGIILGTRLLKLDKELSVLISSGAAICGAAAVLATESVIKSKPWKSTVAVSTVVLFGTLGMCLYPIFYRMGIIPLSLEEMGIYIGGSVHEVAHVVAAGNGVSPETSDTAIIVKMIRVMLLAPFLIVLGAFYFGIKGSVKNKIVIPWFAILFIVMAGVNSLSIIPATAVNYINIIDTFFLTMAMSALGIETNMDKLKGVGMKPVWLGLILFIWLVLSCFALVYFFI